MRLPAVPIIPLLLLLVVSIYSVNSTGNETPPQQPSSQRQEPIPQQHISYNSPPPTHSSNSLPDELHNNDHIQLPPDFPNVPPFSVDHSNIGTSAGSQALGTHHNQAVNADDIFSDLAEIENLHSSGLPENAPPQSRSIWPPFQHSLQAGSSSSAAAVGPGVAATQNSGEMDATVAAATASKTSSQLQVVDELPSAPQFAFGLTSTNPSATNNPAAAAVRRKYRRNRMLARKNKKNASLNSESSGLPENAPPQNRSIWPPFQHSLQAGSSSSAAAVGPGVAATQNSGEMDATVAAATASKTSSQLQVVDELPSAPQFAFGLTSTNPSATNNPAAAAVRRKYRRNRMLARQNKKNASLNSESSGLQENFPQQHGSMWPPFQHSLQAGSSSGAAVGPAGGANEMGEHTTAISNLGTVQRTDMQLLRQPASSTHVPQTEGQNNAVPTADALLRVQELMEQDDDDAAFNDIDIEWLQSLLANRPAADSPFAGELERDFENLLKKIDDHQQQHIGDLPSPIGQHKDHQTSSSATTANAPTVVPGAEHPKPKGGHGKNKNVNPSPATLRNRKRNKKISDKFESAKMDIRALGIIPVPTSQVETFVKYRELILYLEQLLLMHHNEIRGKLAANKTSLEILGKCIANALINKQYVRKEKNNDAINKQLLESNDNKQKRQKKRDPEEKKIANAKSQEKRRNNLNEAVQSLYATMPVPDKKKLQYNVSMFEALDLAQMYQRILHKIIWPPNVNFPGNQTVPNQ